MIFFCWKVSVLTSFFYYCIRDDLLRSFFLNNKSFFLIQWVGSKVCVVLKWELQKASSCLVVKLLLSSLRPKMMSTMTCRLCISALWSNDIIAAETEELAVIFHSNINLSDWVPELGQLDCWFFVFQSILWQIKKIQHLPFTWWTFHEHLRKFELNNFFLKI